MEAELHINLVVVEKSHGGMEQELRFGLDLGRLALLKKMGRLWATFEGRFFHVFNGKIDFFFGSK